MGFDRYQSASDLVNNGFQQPDKEDILKLWVFLVSLTSYDIHQYGLAWGAEFMNSQKFHLKVYGAMYFFGKCVHF